MDKKAVIGMLTAASSTLGLSVPANAVEAAPATPSNFVLEVDALGRVTLNAQDVSAFVLDDECPPHTICNFRCLPEPKF